MLGINTRFLFSCPIQQLLTQLLAGAPYQHQSITTNNNVSKLIQIQFFPLLGHYLWTPNVSTVLFPGYVSTPHAISTARLETLFPSSEHPHCSAGQTQTVDAV